MDATSLSLLDRAGSRQDSDSWNQLVTLYTPLLKAWLHRFQVQSADADDLIQEVLAVVANELPAFRHNQRRGAFRSWLRTILVHRLRDFWRTRKYRPLATGDSDLQHQLNELADEQHDLSQLWNRQHDEQVMQHVLRLVEPRVAPVTWQAFSRQMVDGLPAAEVARQLDISIDSAYAAKSRVLRLLRCEARGLVQ